MLEDFLNRKIGITITKADADKLLQLESVIGLKWSSGNYLAGFTTLKYLDVYPEIWLYSGPAKDRLYYAHDDNNWMCFVKELVTVDEFLAGNNQYEIEEGEFDLLFRS